MKRIFKILLRIVWNSNLFLIFCYDCLRWKKQYKVLVRCIDSMNNCRRVRSFAIILISEHTLTFSTANLWHKQRFANFIFKAHSALSLDEKEIRFIHQISVNILFFRKHLFLPRFAAISSNKFISMHPNSLWIFMIHGDFHLALLLRLYRTYLYNTAKQIILTKQFQNYLTINRCIINFSGTMLRKVVTSSMLLAAAPVANAQQKSAGEPTLKRPSDLSIYSAVEEKYDSVYSTQWHKQMINNPLEL